ncbi:MAG: hypothetical protein K0R54_4666 [Clostridiaceae bacterium]|nr:hypothetical protein [Clostridiaceae bacterium]
MYINISLTFFVIIARSESLVGLLKLLVESVSTGRFLILYEPTGNLDFNDIKLLMSTILFIL